MFQPGCRWFWPDKGCEDYFGEVGIGDHTHRRAVYFKINAPQGKQQRRFVALMHRRDRQQKSLNVLRVERTRRLAVMFEALSPCLSGLIRIDISKKPDLEQFPRLGM